jgi:uncharacterized NAD(P)/FAD-binding protein YdhS
MTDYLNNIVCAFGNSSFIIGRIREALQNFIIIFEKYYGSGNTITFETFLINYLNDAIDLINAIKAGDTEKANAARTEWYKNADNIADFFSAINSYWNKQEWQNLIYDHLRLVENQFVYRLNNQCTSEITRDENVNNQIFKISDYMAEGIIHQFNI